MEISTKLERFNHTLAIGHVGQDSQLKLAVIGHNQAISRLRYERLSDAVDVFVASGLILQIWSAA